MWTMLINYMDDLISVVDPCGVDGRRLINAAGDELDALYPDHFGCPMNPEALTVPGSAFLVLRVAGIAVGCGGVRPLHQNIGELKRVYVLPEHRRKGLARRIVVALEEKSIDLGFNAVWLETGILQPQAIALYKSLDYTEMQCYGAYEDDKWSVCFQKQLPAKP